MDDFFGFIQIDSFLQQTVTHSAKVPVKIAVVWKTGKLAKFFDGDFVFLEIHIIFVNQGNQIQNQPLLFQCQFVLGLDQIIGFTHNMMPAQFTSQLPM